MFSPPRVDLRDERHVLDMDLDMLEPLGLNFFHEFETEDLWAVFNRTKESPKAMVSLKEFRENLNAHRRGNLKNIITLSVGVAIAAFITAIVIYLIYKNYGSCLTRASQLYLRRRYPQAKFTAKEVAEMGGFEFA